MKYHNFKRYLKVFFGSSKLMQEPKTKKQVGLIIDAQTAKEQSEKQKELSHKRHIELQFNIIKRHIEESIEYGHTFTAVEMTALKEVIKELENLGYQVSQYHSHNDGKHKLSIEWYK
jgi:tRNA G26 N,N-dimethylase Trm1